MLNDFSSLEPNCFDVFIDELFSEKHKTNKKDKEVLLLSWIKRQIALIAGFDSLFNENKINYFNYATSEIYNFICTSKNIEVLEKIQIDIASLMPDSDDYIAAETTGVQNAYISIYECINFIKNSSKESFAESFYMVTANINLVEHNKKQNFSVSKVIESNLDLINKIIEVIVRHEADMDDKLQDIINSNQLLIIN